MLVGDLGRAPTKNWGPIPGGRDAWNPPPTGNSGVFQGPQAPTLRYPPTATSTCH